MTEVVVLEMNAVYYCILIVSLLSKQTIQAVVVTITSSYYSAFYSEVQYLKVTLTVQYSWKLGSSLIVFGSFFKVKFSIDSSDIHIA